MTASLLTAGLVNTGGGGFDKLVGFEHMIGGQFGDNLTTDNSPNTVDGKEGSDTLSLDAGNDTFDALEHGPTPSMAATASLASPTKSEWTRLRAART